MNEYQLTVHDDSRRPQGLAAVVLAFKRALASQLHPKMLMAVLLPFIIALLGAIVLLWVFWEPLNNWLMTQSADWGVLNTIDGWLLAIGLFSIKLYMIPLLAAGILLPMSGILGLVIAAVFIMPIVLGHLDKSPHYQGLRRNGHNATVLSAWNAVWVGGLFVLGWLLTMPLWLFPPFAVLLPIFWWCFAITRMLRVDAVVEHASVDERRYLWKRHNRQWWLIGFCLALVNLLPPAWLIMPVFSSLVFAHFGMEALRQHRLSGVS
ncbi:EI24 domain-containing protein [Achromobacter sp. F4_2707]|uniref:EI24 domain-containing protein n=1 Tax=Achromobacter sp. F4_2707 TaxID=3114286 RepID=UPI0039C66CDC